MMIIYIPIITLILNDYRNDYSYFRYILLAKRMNITLYFFKHTFNINRINE